MSEPQPTESGHAGPLSDEEREARIEQLLLSGLDHYFGGKYDHAINIWTRVAFLERGHGRARAYIERARGALAERQRESDELLHTGVAAYDAGDLPTARELLTRALDRGGPNETALLFLQRLSRLEPTSTVVAGEDALPRPPDKAAHQLAPAQRVNWMATVLASVVAAAAILLGTLPVMSWLAQLPVAGPAIEAPAAEPLPIVRSADTLLERARDHYSAGRLRDALLALERIDLADPLRREADRLRADVQRDLLATVTTGTTR